MPKPRVAIADPTSPTRSPQGLRRIALSCIVTTGLLRRLDRDELEGSCHWLKSCRPSRCDPSLTIASFAAILWPEYHPDGRSGVELCEIAGTTTALAVMRRSWPCPALVTFCPASSRRHSRYRELAADRGGRCWPVADSATALQKISGDVAQIPTSDLRQMEAVSSMAFIPALGRGRGFDLAKVFSSHPPLEKRLGNLAKVSSSWGAVAPWVSSTMCLGRKKTVQPDLDQLFQLPAAAITLQSVAGLRAHRYRWWPFRAPGQGLRGASRPRSRPCSTPGRSEGRVGARLVRLHVARGASRPPDVAGLVTDLQPINATLRTPVSDPPCCVRWWRSGTPRDRCWAWSTCSSRAPSIPLAPSPGATVESNPAATTSSRSRWRHRRLGPGLQNTLARWFTVWGPRAGVALSGIC